MRWWATTTVLALLTLGVGWSEPASADIYMYRDGRGRLHFTNAPANPGYRKYAPRKAGVGAYRFHPRRDSARDRVRRTAYDPIIHEVAQRHRIDPALIKAVIRQESDFVAYARSPKGAVGLMQLMPGTARMHRVWRVFDPRENIEGGARHLRLLLDQYNGNVRLALAAYNAGGGAVSRYNGVPPYRETVEYLQRVLAFREQYSRQP